MDLRIAAANILVVCVVNLVTGVYLNHRINRLRDWNDEAQAPTLLSFRQSQTENLKTNDDAEPSTYNTGHVANATGDADVVNNASTGKEKAPPNSSAKAIYHVQQGTQRSNLSKAGGKPSQPEDEDGGHGERCNFFEDIGLQQHDSFKGLEYLGCGYDVTKARPFGDEETFVDTGYTQPVIQFKWDCANATSPDPTPMGVWVRREAACHRGHSTRDIKNEETLASILAEDIDSSFGIGISVNYNKQIRDIKGMADVVKKHGSALKSSCAVFTTGMVLSTEWDVTRAFRNATKMLAEYPGKEKCRATEDYRPGGSCSGYYRLWERFFNSYGTNVISKLTMGGKLLNIVDNIDTHNNEASSRNEANHFNAMLALLSAKASKTVDKELEEEKMQQEKGQKCFVIGGDSYISPDSPDGFRRWMDSVEDNAMPIKIQLTPMSQFLPKDIRGHFWMAVNLYTDKG
ncbi:MAC/Perforin domain containing protein [Babesia caballi]|uniref:MAC/Perforin domain containing protein n=1 Tax=Babesia caballi TaxID=5871 RepID=A0AAV4LQ11_BABCB|nr:MAC/Perforin domain containing protein [Babesia caballi]